MDSTLKSMVIGFTTIWLCACGFGVNQSFTIADGTTLDGGRTTVNGRITVGTNCEVSGDCQTVNGRITVGEGSRVGALHTVNGRIEIGSSVRVNGDVATVNGSIGIQDGTAVDGDVSTVNGGITLVGSTVGGTLTVHNGDVVLLARSRVKKDVVIKKGKSSSKRGQEIRVSDGSVVEGDVIVRGARGEVTVHLSGGGEVKGEVRGAEVVTE
jgi:DUF4097 and DUF4098 domain-containing protein YvlB